MNFKDKAIVVYRQPFSESSWRLYAFSSQFGLVHLLAKGARKLGKGKFDLELFQLSELEWISKKNDKDLGILIEAKSYRVFNYLQSDLKKWSLLHVVAETLIKIPVQSEDAKVIFESVNKLMVWLEEKKDLLPFMYYRVLLRFWMQLFDLLGYGWSLDYCESCNAPLEHKHVSQFVLECGSFICDRCSEIEEISNSIYAIARNKSIDNMNLSHWENVIEKVIPFFSYHLSKAVQFKSLVQFYQMQRGEYESSIP
jgi:DNA repair protein RecO